MLLNFNTGYADTDADLCIRIMSLCRKSLIHAVSANDKACNCDSCVKLSKYERKSEKAHIPHAPILLENSVYNKWQFQALVTGNRTGI